MTEAYIFDAIRTPRGKGRPDGSLHEVTSARLSAGVLNDLKSRNNLEGHAVEDVIWGNVTQVGEQGGCLARTAVLASQLDQSIPGLAINRFCASGMEAVNLAANQVKGGAGGAYIAGGDRRCPGRMHVCVRQRCLGCVVHRPQAPEHGGRPRRDAVAQGI